MKKRVHKIQLKDVGLIVYDFDGVLTDNRAIVSEKGAEGVMVNRSDGLAIDMMRRSGVEQVILTTEKNKTAVFRARKLRIPIKYGIDDKRDALERYCKIKGIPLGKVVYVGNDVNDLDAMAVVGWPVCPSDAYRAIKDVSRMILKTPSGSGAVRELAGCIFGGIWRI
ncbi:MAG: HAD hydrolase family protein [Candidatus Omnitrophica bacterium]|nr:HAD hydrolase family protein [Candidatus Omnitrophota bacterium]